MDFSPVNYFFIAFVECLHDNRPINDIIPNFPQGV